jgi:hypothetical protein
MEESNDHMEESTDQIRVYRYKLKSLRTIKRESLRTMRRVCGPGMSLWTMKRVCGPHTKSTDHMKESMDNIKDSAAYRSRERVNGIRISRVYKKPADYKSQKSLRP